MNNKSFHIVVFMLLMSLTARTQNTLVKYYDRFGAVVPKEKAEYYEEFTKETEGYKSITYWMDPNKIRSKSTYSDTLKRKPLGLQLWYYRNGNIQDSAYYNDDGNRLYGFHYYENKQLAAHYYVHEGKKEPVIEGFDESGNRIKNYIYEKEADFKGGEKAWHKYLIKSVTKDFQHTTSNEEISVTVRVQFVVDKTGNVVQPKIVKSSGFDFVDRDAERVISSSPAWNNAIQYNRPVNAFRVQPFTYLLSPIKKSKRSK